MPTLIIRVPKLNDGPTDFDWLFRVWAQLTGVRGDIAFDFSECGFFAQNAAAFIGGQDMKTLPLDGYDLLTIQSLRQSGIAQVVSDDGDFCTVPGITLFTSNRGVLTAAHGQGKLLVR